MIRFFSFNPVPFSRFLDNTFPQISVVRIDISLSVGLLALIVRAGKSRLFQMVSCNDASSFSGVFRVTYFLWDRYFYQLKSLQNRAQTIFVNCSIPATKNIVQGCWANSYDGNRRKVVRISPTM